MFLTHFNKPFLLYNKYQEPSLQRDEEEQTGLRISKTAKPMVDIPEANIKIYSRCLICRKDETGQLVDLLEDDFEKVKEYLVEPISSREKS